MASFPNQPTTTSNSTDTAADEATATDDPADETNSDSPGLLARLAQRTRTLADVLAPFSTLLTGLVQLLTVAQLARQA